MTQSFVPVATLLVVLGALLHGATAFPFQSAKSIDDGNRKLVDDLLEVRTDGGKDSMHAFRESAFGLASHPDFLKGDRASATDLHEIIFVIREKNIDELTRILHDISDPTSANYGNHMTFKEISDLVSNPIAHQEVVSYLLASGATVNFKESQGECISARAEIGLWERMLNTKFHTYSKVTPASASKWPVPQTEFIRSDTYSVPAGLDDHVAFIFNTIQTPELKYQKKYLEELTPVSHKVKSKFTEAQATSKTVPGFTSPAQMYKAYNIEDTTGHPLAVQGAFESFRQIFSPEDLAIFQDFYKLPIVPPAAVYEPFTRTSAQCKALNFDICIESNADMMYMLAMANTPTVHYYSTFNTFAQWAQYIGNSGVQPPLVISISYGNDENLYSVGEYELFQTSVIKLSAMGCTIVIACGDDGVHTGQTRFNKALCGYKPQYPTGCPYVISVGATLGIEYDKAEIVCSNDRGGGITSGGGFSSNYARPEWQKAAVDKYFATVMGTSKEPVPGYASGRGYPDISAAGSNMLMYAGGGLFGAAGTSVSAPIAGGVLSLVNAARFRAGGKPIGFISPILYQYADQFMNDVTVGKNNCSASSICCTQGFSAAPGWDPASGLGSIDFKRFRNFMLSVANLPVPSSPVSSPTQKPSTFIPPVVLSVQTFSPVSSPTNKPVSPPTNKPVSPPTNKPVSPPTNKPVSPPTDKPVYSPTNKPVSPPTDKPVSSPTNKPVSPPTDKPVSSPTNKPVSPPTDKPVSSPTNKPESPPLGVVSIMPVPQVPRSATPTGAPTNKPSMAPSDVSYQGGSKTSSKPSSLPSGIPTASPSAKPSSKPSSTPSGAPVAAATAAPSSKPSPLPSGAPTNTKPEIKITARPVALSTNRPTMKPRRPRRTPKPTRLPSLDSKSQGVTRSPSKKRACPSS